jgi:hypothetical protein
MSANRQGIGVRRTCQVRGRTGRFWLVMKHRRTSRVRQMDCPEAKDELIDTHDIIEINAIEMATESTADNPPHRRNRRRERPQPDTSYLAETVPSSDAARTPSWIPGDIRQPNERDHLKKELRILETEKLLVAATHDTHVLAELQRRYGVKEATAKEYLREAKRNMIEAVRKDHLEHLAEAINFYRQVIANPKEPTINRIKAQTRLDKLLGLEAPQRHILFPGTEPPPFEPALQRRALQNPLILEKAAELDELLAQDAGRPVTPLLEQQPVLATSPSYTDSPEP